MSMITIMAMMVIVLVVVVGFCLVLQMPLMRMLMMLLFFVGFADVACSQGTLMMTMLRGFALQRTMAQ